MDCWPSPNQISWDSDCHALPLNSPLLKEVRASGQSSAIHDLSGHLSFNRSSMSQWCYMVLYESKWFLMILVIFTYDSMYVYHCVSVILCDSLMLPWSFYLHRHIHLPGDQQMAAVCFEPSLWTTQTREVSLDLLTCLAKGDSERPVALVALRKIMMIGSLRLIKSGIESPCNQVCSSSLCKMMWLHLAINRWGILWCWWHAKCYLQQQASTNTAASVHHS